MSNTSVSILSRQHAKSIYFDLLALIFIYFIPTFSHMLSMPLYLIEPMRLMMILAIAHTSKRNAYLIAFTLPLFSTLVSMHPVFVKTLLISGELVLNVFLFYFMIKRINNQFFAMMASILISKIFYYLIKFLLISTLIFESALFSTPVYLQIITTVIFSGYLFVILRYQIKKASM